MKHAMYFDKFLIVKILFIPVEMTKAVFYAI